MNKKKEETNVKKKQIKSTKKKKEDDLEIRMFSFSLFPAFRIHDLPKPNKHATASDQSTNKSPDSENNMPNKPSIIEIINETEKNSGRLQASPLVPDAVETSKAIMDVSHGHPGIAEPLTWHQLESEMAAVDQSLRDSSTSTSKDGISTWILLSGSEKQKPSSTPASTTVAGQVDKLEVKDVPSVTSERHNYRFEPINQDKLTKPSKNRPEKKSKPTTPEPSASSTSPILLASDFIAASKLANRRKHPVAQVKVNKRKTVTTTRSTPTTTTTIEPITTTTTTPAYEPVEIETEKNSAEPNALVERTEEIEVVTVPITTTPYPFIVLEPKDADFDLPQDRSPTTKKPKRNNSKTKRKNGQKNKVAAASSSNAVSKLPTNKDKPISTKIYNYLSREVMPTVGVGLMGLVVTAGLASYFFGPLTALRRSYDDALDRQDNADNIYQVNSEEYATNGAEGGQNEEEIFGKFIAGMPASNVPKYVRYYKPEPAVPYQANAYNTQRRVYGQQIGPKYNNGPNPYVRYRAEPNNNAFQKNAPSPHFNPAQYHPQHLALRNHQPVSPVYDPRYHETQEQKSFANKMDQILKQQPAYTADAADQTVQIHEKSTGTDILAEEMPQIEAKHAGTVLDDDIGSDGSENKIQRRTNTYVVGTALSDIRPDETIVSASMTAASADDMIQSNPNAPVAAAMTAVTAASHGPRRRRRRSAAIVEEIKVTTTEKKPDETTVVPDATISSTTQTAYTGRVYDRNELKLLEVEFNRLKMKMAASDNTGRDSEVEKKIQKKIQTEFDHIESDFLALKRAIDAVQDIETFQRQLKIRAKNYELSMGLRTGITQIRQRIKWLVELIEHPEDDRIVQKINRRDGTSNTGSEIPNVSTTSEPGADNTDEHDHNGFIGFLKLLQLKAQFGLNILKTIKPSFERAFEEVFKRPLKED